MAGPSSDEGDDDDAVARGRHDEEDAQQYDSDKDVDLLRALSPADDSASERLFARTDHDRRAATPRLAPPVANGSSSGSRSTSGAGRSSRFLTTSVAKSHRCDYSPDPSQHTSSTHSWSSPRSHSSSSRSSHSSRRPSSRISRSSSRSPSSSSLRQSRSTRATRTYGHSPSRSPVHPSYSPFAGSHASKNLVQEVEQEYHELQRRESQRRSMQHLPARYDGPREQNVRLQQATLRMQTQRTQQLASPLQQRPSPAFSAVSTSSVPLPARPGVEAAQRQPQVRQAPLRRGLSAPRTVSTPSIADAAAKNRSRMVHAAWVPTVQNLKQTLTATPRGVHQADNERERRSCCRASTAESYPNRAEERTVLIRSVARDGACCYFSSSPRELVP